MTHRCSPTSTPVAARFPRGGVRRGAWLVLIALLGLGLGLVSSTTCLRTGLTRGLWLDECPDGALHQRLSVSAGGLTRGASTTVSITAAALYTSGPADSQHSEALGRFTPELSLVSGDTVLAPLVPLKGWQKNGDSLSGEIALPTVNDGQYTLRATVTSVIETSSLDLALPLFTPARVHVITDRPLYQPGNTVQFRALALKGADLTPLEERPGVWTVQDPSGETLLEERAPTKSWGVSSGSFPLDQGAQSGDWRVTWSSGAASATRTFTVKPFTLPRFRIDASALKPFYRRGEKPVLKGRVNYSSGAPVGEAKVQLRWHVGGAWPPPTSWVDGSALPTLATTDANGGFSVELPAVPGDLAGQVSLSASLAAVDKAGDRVEGGASVLLSEDPIAVSAVTELASGLVEGFNNRLFLRATTADGRLLEGVTLSVKRLWEATDRGTDATVDEDGVASLQVDPGPPVNVIIPALPFRPPPRAKAVQRQRLSNFISGEEEQTDVSLADRLVFDRVDARVEGCARYAHGSGEEAVLGLLVHASGAQGPLAQARGKLAECVAAAVRTLKFEPGHERFFEAAWAFDDSDLPALQLATQGVPDVDSALTQALEERLLDARDCLPATVKSGQLPRLLEWRTDGKKVELSWVAHKGASALESAVGCITSRVGSFSLSGEPGPAGPTSVGVGWVSVVAPAKYEASRPQDTVLVGYEFQVTAKRGKELLGSTRLRMSPGAVPPIRLRAKEQLVDPGSTVTVEILRGPDFTGELPEQLFLTHAYQRVEAKVNPETRTAQFSVPLDWQGWAAVEWSGGQVFFFVRARAPLTVAVTPEKTRYAPGQIAQLAIQTTLGTTPGPAAVGLIGVDDSLGQLVSLPNAEELSGLRSQPTSSPAFGGIDAQALALGRVRGANAAAATMIRVAALPPPPEQEVAVSVSGSTTFDANAVLVDHFYVALSELAVQVREWERSAPAAEKMSNATMAKLWRAALDALDRRKEPARDVWDRPLRLHRLPSDLLALTEPRALVIDGTRLPEDIQNWSQWVAKEKP